MNNNLIAFIVLILSACSVQNEFKVTLPGEEPQKHIEKYYYVLPQTVMKVKLEVNYEKYLPGPYHRFSERYLGITGVEGLSNSRYFPKNVSVDYLTEPDPQRYFSVNLISGKFTASDYLMLSKHGLTLDPSGWIKHSADFESRKAGPDMPYFTDLTVSGLYREVTDTLYKTIVTDTSFIRLPIPRRQREVKTIEQRAEEAANFILEIRRSRFDLLAGELDGFPGGSALEFAVQELNKIEQQYLELFTGKVIREKYSKTIFVTPDGTEQTIIICKISEDKGFLNASAKEGVSVVLKISPLNKLQNIPVMPVQTSSLAVNNLFYRLPDMAIIQISIGNDVFYEERSVLYQAGKMVNLPVRE